MDGSIFAIARGSEGGSGQRGLITKGITSARLLTRARILLKADEGWKDKEIAQALNSSVATIERIRRRFAEGNLEKALHDDPRLGGLNKMLPGQPSIGVS